MKTAFSDLTDSRTFWVAVMDASVSTLAVMLALFLNPTIVDKILAVVAMWQPVILALIIKMGAQNVAGIRAGAAIEAAKVAAEPPK
jgi:hypothetical protein